MTTYKTHGDAMRDPNSPIHAKLQKSREQQAQHDAAIQRLVASGLSREQAYQRLLYGR